MRHTSRRSALAALALVLVAGAGAPDRVPKASAGDASDRSPAELVALARDLAAAVDQPTPKSRALAAGALATRAGVSVDDWQRVMVAFTPAGARPTAGAATETASLPVLDATETTSIAVVVPATLPKVGPAGLLLAFHGQGGHGGQMTAPWTATAEAAGLLVVAPTDAGKNEGYLFSPRERASAIAALRWARRRYDVDENRVFVTGWSRGGHMAWDVALHFPDQFAAVIPVVGAPRVANQQAQNNVRYLENLVDVSIRDLQGSKDDPRALKSLHLAFERFAAWKARDAKLIEFPDRAHDADLSAVDWNAFFGATSRDPRRNRVVRRAAAPGTARSAYAEILSFDATVAEQVSPVQPKDWNQMSDDAKRAFIEGEIDKKTARLEVVRAAPNRFEAKSTGVARWRLLLDADMADASKPVLVVWNGKTITRGVSPSKAVLLKDFVERFDRTFLPVIEVAVP